MKQNKNKQPTFAMSDKNPNLKMKRWKSFIENCSLKFFYKPGEENIVAGDLSRQYVNQLSECSDDVEGILTGVRLPSVVDFVSVRK